MSDNLPDFNTCPMATKATEKRQRNVSINETLGKTQNYGKFVALTIKC